MTREFCKSRMQSSRGYFPLASLDEIMRVINENNTQTYRAIENFLDKHPKKSVNENLAKKLLEDFGIKIHSDYVLPL